MNKDTPLQRFLNQIILKKVKGSVYLIPAITDIQIEEALKDELESSNPPPSTTVKEDKAYSKADVLKVLRKESNELKSKKEKPEFALDSRLYNIQIQSIDRAMELINNLLPTYPDITLESSPKEEDKKEEATLFSHCPNCYGDNVGFTDNLKTTLTCNSCTATWSSPKEKEEKTTCSGLCDFPDCTLTECRARENEEAYEVEKIVFDKEQKQISSEEIEKASVDYLEESIDNNELTLEEQETAKHDFRNGAKWLLSITPSQGDSWISVEDRLPENDPDQVIINSRVEGKEDVVICAVYYIGRFFNIEEWGTCDPEEHDDIIIDSKRITHWMPLPSPPKQD